MTTAPRWPASVLLDRTKIGAGVIRRETQGSAAPISALYYIGAAYDITPAFTLAGQVYYLNYNSSDNKSMLYAIRGMYNFSKRTAVYATAGFINNDGNLTLSVSGAQAGANPKPGGQQFGAMLGINAHLLIAADARGARQRVLCLGAARHKPDGKSGTAPFPRILRAEMPPHRART